MPIFPPDPRDVPPRTAYSPAEVCALLHVSQPTLYKAIASGKLRSFKVAGSRRISHTAIEDYIRAGERGELGFHVGGRPTRPVLPARPVLRDGPKESEEARNERLRRQAKVASEVAAAKRRAERMDFHKDREEDPAPRRTSKPKVAA